MLSDYNKTILATIEGSRLLDKADSRIKKIVVLLYLVLEEKLDEKLVVTSGYREGDPRQHGQGYAVDFTLPYMHIFEYAPITYKIIDKLSQIYYPITSFGMYEGIDGDGKWKTHIHIDIMANRNVMSVYTGTYKK